MAEKEEPLLKKLYYENCPGCRVEKINETQEGLPIKNFFYAWAVVLTAGLIPCVVLLLGLFFVPESPRWLAKVGCEKEFKASLQKLRGKDADISKEAAEIQDYVGMDI